MLSPSDIILLLDKSNCIMYAQIWSSKRDRFWSWWIFRELLRFTFTNNLLEMINLFEDLLSTFSSLSWMLSRFTGLRYWELLFFPIVHYCAKNFVSFNSKKTSYINGIFTKSTFYFSLKINFLLVRVFIRNNLNFIFT